MTISVCVPKYFDAQIRSKRKFPDKIMSYDSRGSQEAPNATRGSQERRRATPEDFAFGKLIGEGSFSSVFLAKEVKPDREVAIKVNEAVSNQTGFSRQNTRCSNSFATFILYLRCFFKPSLPVDYIL